MAKRRRKVRRKRSSTSTSSSSSSSSVPRRPVSSSSSSSSSSSAEAAKPSKRAASGTVPQASRALILVPSLLALRDKSRVMTQGPEYDPSDGAIVYSTKDVALYQQDKTQKTLSDNWGRFRHYCCKRPDCELFFDHQRSSRVKLMLDVVKTLPNSGRSNKRKLHQVLDKILSRT